MANKKEKKIDIILPNFNSSEYIKETIKSIIDQTFKNWKLIIVDDCSDKKTRTLLKKFSKNKRIKIYWLKKNKGAGYCRNYAIKKSKSPYLAFIDSDDIWKKDKLETQLRFMENNNYLFTYTNYETFGKKIKFISPAKECDFIFTVSHFDFQFRFSTHDIPYSIVYLRCVFLKFDFACS